MVQGTRGETSDGAPNNIKKLCTTFCCLRCSSSSSCCRSCCCCCLIVALSSNCLHNLSSSQNIKSLKIQERDGQRHKEFKREKERERDKEVGRGRAAKKSLLTRTTFSQSEIQNQTATTTWTLGCPMDTAPLPAPLCTAASTCCYLCQRKFTAPHSGMNWNNVQTKIYKNKLIVYMIYIKSTK